jgi:hypothetical protein
MEWSVAAALHELAFLVGELGEAAATLKDVRCKFLSPATRSLSHAETSLALVLQLRDLLAAHILVPPGGDGSGDTDVRSQPDLAARQGILHCLF